MSTRSIDRSALGITPLLPGIHLSSERVAVVPASIQTLPIKDADLDLRHVEPAGVFRGVVEYDAAQQRLCLLNTKRFLETTTKVGVEVIHDQVNAVRLGVHLLKQVPDKGDEVSLGALRCDDDRARTPFGFDCHEQVTCSSANILVIVLRRHTRLERQRGSRVAQQLFAFLVQADDSDLVK
ncbi:hypothetical protein SAMN05421754_11262 [Nitrosomonas sp. Nm58]|nr:hypothetical protein SAMN05421754_11262 [Nitrosomonas sp. Nm58]